MPPLDSRHLPPTREELAACATFAQRTGAKGGWGEDVRMTCSAIEAGVLTLSLPPGKNVRLRR